MRFSLIAFLALAACTRNKVDPGQLGDACSASAPCSSELVCRQARCAAPTRHYTFRAIAGVSMGASGSSRLVAAHPEKFDAAGFLGGPLDAVLLMRTIERSFMGGFCPADKLEAAAALDGKDGDDRLDRPDGVPGCVQQNPPPLTHYSRSQRFNHWAFTTNGGTFDRGMHLDIFRDLTLAIGNPFSFPITHAQLDAATCAQPFVVPHVYDPVYSPHGEHPAITFCDGDPPIMLCADGTLVDWCAAARLAGRQLAVAADAALFCLNHGGGAHEADKSSAAEADVWYAHKGELPGCFAGTQKVPFALAIDVNGNGRRDYHEPLLIQAHEPFSDVGTDGCDDAHEDGKGGCLATATAPPGTDPNHDNYDPVTNPTGTEGDGRWEPGEPFQDIGLDGVAATFDTGEGDGVFTVSPGLQAWMDGDLRLHPPSNVDLYVEGGIRDVFDLGAMAEGVAGAAIGVTSFADFRSIPPDRGIWGSTFDPLRIDMTALGRNVLLEYGTPNATPAEIRGGDGDHVGTLEQVFDRFAVFFRWLSKRWDPMLPPPAKGAGTVTVLNFFSTALGTQQDFVVSVPSKYDAPENASRRYPVLFLLHGYGQNAEDMAGTDIAVRALADLGLVHDMIVVYPSGRCCLTGPHGERTCDESNGTPDGYVRECARGSFYLGKYEQALFELMGEIDKRYRTLSPADGPAF